MMTQINFDHKQQNMAQALGITEGRVEEMRTSLANKLNQSNVKCNSQAIELALDMFTSFNEQVYVAFMIGMLEGCAQVYEIPVGKITGDLQDGHDELN